MCDRKSISPHRDHLPCRAFRCGGIVRGLPGEPSENEFRARIAIQASSLSLAARASIAWGASVTSDSRLGAESRTNLKELWRAALGELQLAMPKANYDTWFKETYVVSEEDDVFCIGVPNAFARE